MSFCVFGGAVLRCSFGMAPTPLTVLPDSKVVSTMPAATIMDNKPMVNITPFVMCSSILNPQVAAATAAALGVLTPMPCVPMLTAPWVPGSLTVLVGQKPALNQDSKLVCGWGGVIGIDSAGTSNIQIP